MKLLSQLSISRPEGAAIIRLLHGDLTALPKEFAVDILVVSAYRHDYRTNRKTLMTSLFNAGISVAELAKDKEIDLLSQLSCWLSKPLSKAQQAQLNVKKILCFEPLGSVKDVETEVGNLFRGINSFAMSEDNNEIAMPVLSTGDRAFPLEVMLPSLLDAALFWLENGLPLKLLTIVLHQADQVEKGFPIFEQVREQYELKKLAEAGRISAGTALSQLEGVGLGKFLLPKMALALREMNLAEPEESLPDSMTSRGLDNPESFIPKEYDYFISYSHKHSAAVQEFVNALQARNPLFRIFYDRDTIPQGGLWIKLISDAIQNSKNVICILTPEYSQSAVCWDEFQCAYIMEKRNNVTIKTINFCNDADLPPMIAIRSYIDCTEGDLNKLKKAAEELV